MELRDLPSVDSLTQIPELAGFPPQVRVAAAREAIDEARGRMLEGKEPDDVRVRAPQLARGKSRTSLNAAINLSGVVAHTGLGRARLAPAVAAHVEEVAAGYSNLEFDLESGARGDRQDHVRGLIQQLTGAEDALVVNNAAAGVVLTLSALASGKEVVLSRGQMVEIGGSFRMPDIVRQSGCKLVEVGCTNRTRISDYEEAITAETAALLRCHPSNFRVIGFTEEPELAELALVARDGGVRLIDDQGSGLLVDARTLGLPQHPTLPESVAHADVAIASGDKMIGGPQAGIIAGRWEAIHSIRRHPLARAFRIDKLSLAALEATLRLWTNGMDDEIPLVRYLRRPATEVRELAERLAKSYPGAVVEEAVTETGSGSAPGTGVPTFRLGLPGDAESVARRLRTGHPPIVPRIEHGRVWLDPRTLDSEEVPVVEQRLREISNDDS